MSNLFLLGEWVASRGVLLFPHAISYSTGLRVSELFHLMLQGALSSIRYLCELQITVHTTKLAP